MSLIMALATQSQDLTWPDAVAIVGCAFATAFVLWAITR